MKQHPNTVRFFVFLLCIAMLPAAQAWQYDFFSDGTTSANYTFTYAQNHTKNFSIETGATVTGANITLSPQNGSAPINLSRGHIVPPLTYSGAWISAPELAPENANDADWTTYSRIDIATTRQFLLNFTLEPQGSYSVHAKANLDTGTGEVSISCWNQTSNNWVTVINVTGAGASLSEGSFTTVTPWCHNISTLVRFLYTVRAGAVKAYFYETNLSGTKQFIPDYPRNLTVYVDNSLLYNFGATNNSPFNNTVFINLTEVLRFRNNSLIPFTIYSNVSSILLLGNLSIEILTLNVSTYREDTGAKITTPGTITVSNGVSSFNFSTNSNGDGGTSRNFSAGTWTVGVVVPGYAQRFYTVTFTEGVSELLNAYLTNETTTTTLTIKSSSTGENLEGAIVTITTSINGSYTEVFSKASDVTGRVVFPYTAGLEYVFTVVKEGYTTKTFSLFPIVFSTYTVNLDKSVTSGYSLTLDDVSIGITPQVFYNNIVNNVTFSILSGRNILTSYYIYIDYPGGSNLSTGSSSAGESFYTRFNITNAGLFDHINVTFAYNTSTNVTDRALTYQYTIQNANIPAYTWAKGTQDLQGSGYLERAIIATIAAIVMGGFVGLVAGTFAAGIMIMLTFIGFVYVGWLPFYTVAPAIVLGIVLIASRSSE
jgi:hypothetical protein